MKSLRNLFGIFVVTSATIVASATLYAHMKVEKSEPAADATVTAPLKTVQIFFSEAPDVKVSKLEIKGPSATTKLAMLHVMDKSLMAMVEGDTPDGSYAVSWQSAGPDGHIQKGDFVFTVKRK
jgi:hypothetical protein